MNSRFSTAVHILTLLASMPGERLTSEFIAVSVGTNPVVIRRQLALLRNAALVDSKGARGGGWVLARAPGQIALSQVRVALGSEAQFRMHRNEPHPNCVVGQNVRQALSHVYADAEEAVNTSLKGWTIEDLLNEVQSAARRKRNRAKAQPASKSGK
ncbi:MAG: Rrf2 family transcriptional regulator [Terracidiphilus sp.]|nr:Rrf2 family transcriptional regulator [Terracidiphilus sp.]